MPKVTRVFAELVTGEIVCLAKDCGCKHHEGPHWLFVDQSCKEVNQQCAQDARNKGNGLLLEHYAQEEARRLAEKTRHFKNLGIARLVPIDEVPKEVRNSTGMKHKITSLLENSLSDMERYSRDGRVTDKEFRAYRAIWNWINFRFSGAAEQKQSDYQERYGFPALKEKINKTRKSFGFDAI